MKSAYCCLIELIHHTRLNGGHIAIFGGQPTGGLRGGHGSRSEGGWEGRSQAQDGPPRFSAGSRQSPAQGRLRMGVMADVMLM
jgi:hypothetical protein